MSLGGKISSEGTKRTLMAAMTVPEGIIMLTIAVILDVFGLVLFILSLFKVGVPLSWLLDFMGLPIVVWTITRPFYRTITSKIAAKIGKTVGKAVNRMPTFREEGGQPGAAGAKAATKAGKAGKTITKGGARVGLGIAATIATIIVEVTPFLGDIFPTWTLRVIYELIQGEVTSL